MCIMPHTYTLAKSYVYGIKSTKVRNVCRKVSAKILQVHFSLRVLSGSANASKIWPAKLFNSTSLSNLISPSQLAGYYERKDNYNNVMIMVATAHMSVSSQGGVPCTI